MVRKSRDQVSTSRKERNEELLRRMRNGEKLTSYNSVDSWYPPRPIIAKDQGAIERLYGTEIDERLSSALKSKDKNALIKTRNGKQKPLRLA